MDRTLRSSVLAVAFVAIAPLALHAQDARPAADHIPAVIPEMPKDIQIPQDVQVPTVAPDMPQDMQVSPSATQEGQPAQNEQPAQDNGQSQADAQPTAVVEDASAETVRTIAVQTAGRGRDSLTVKVPEKAKNERPSTNKKKGNAKGSSKNVAPEPQSDEREGHSDEAWDTEFLVDGFQSGGAEHVAEATVAAAR